MRAENMRTKGRQGVDVASMPIQPTPVMARRAVHQPQPPRGDSAVTAQFTAARRVVVKIGSSLLVNPESGTLKRSWLESLGEDVAGLGDRGQEVILVSSGAVALGRRQLGLTGTVQKLEVSQAAAAVGQIRLAHAYQEILGTFGLNTAQILLTSSDTESRQRYLNARSTITTLLKLGSVPVINENDTIATDEIRVGDNDRLAGRVAEMMSADCFVLLSDVSGLYSADPRRDLDATLIREVHDITPEIEAMAGSAASSDSRGGMATKLAAARIALAAGCHVVIADGAAAHPLKAIEAGAPCTWFIPGQTPRTARKLWILGSPSTGRADPCRRRRRRRPGERQEPAAGGRQGRRGRLPAGRRGTGLRARRA